MSCEQAPSPNSIAAVNDAFRRSGPTHDWLITKGAAALPDTVGLIGAVILFDDFTPDNDPWGEHDLCNFQWSDEKVYAKIDYYDQELQYWCDPLSEECRRVLTIMLASEY